MASRPVISYCSGATSTGLWIESGFGGVFAHSDGVNWTATHNLRSRLPTQDSLACGTRYRAQLIAAMPPEAQALHAWVTGLKFDLPGKIITQPRPEDEAVVSDTIDGTTVVYQGYGKKKIGEYAFAKIREIVTKSVELCMKTWGWAPEIVRFSLHPAARAMGMAFQPGILDSTKTRRVSLSRELFKKYDANAIHRVVIHELCHHYREERWPRPRTRYTDGHDAKFCSELQRVDAIVATNPRQCQFFEEQVDPTIAAAVAQKREAGVVWSPDAGTVVMSRLKSGEVRLSWEPVYPGPWKPTKTPANDTTLLALIQHFAPSQWKEVRVAGYWRPGVSTLADLLAMLLAMWPKVFLRTRAYIESIAPSA